MKMIGKIIGMLILAVWLSPSGSGFVQAEVARNVCEESHSACITQCASFYKDDPASQTQSPFYKSCTDACGAGLKACAKEKVNSMSSCSEFEFNCLDHCPGVEFDDEQGIFVDKSEQGEYCMDACEAGRKYCGGIVYGQESQ
jgi:hypothetical protein